MSKYNVGDVVKLRDDLEDEQEFDIIAGTFVVDEEVLELKNTPLKIVAYKKKHGFYIVEFSDGKTGRICDEMIEGLWEECNQVKKYNDHTLDAWRYAVESKLSEQVSKLKLIDVLNMIAKGELKEGTKVKYEDVENTYKIKTLVVGGDIYEDVEVLSRQTLITAIEQSKVIAIRKKGKKIYVNANYIVSFEES